MPPVNNQYDFIMSSDKKAKKPGLSLPSNNTTGKKIFIMMGLFGALIIFFIVLSFIAGKGGEDKTMFLNLLRQQTELSRIAGLGAGEASANQGLQNTASNTQVVVTSDKQLLNAALIAKKITIKPKEIAKSTNPATDARLASAKAAANFDTMYISILDEQLVDYQNNLQQAYDASKSKSIKDTLSLAYQHTQELKKQVDAIQR